MHVIICFVAQVSFSSDCQLHHRSYTHQGTLSKKYAISPATADEKPWSGSAGFNQILKMLLKLTQEAPGTCTSTSHPNFGIQAQTSCPYTHMHICSDIISLWGALRPDPIRASLINDLGFQDVVSWRGRQFGYDPQVRALCIPRASLFLNDGPCCW